MLGSTEYSAGISDIPGIFAWIRGCMTGKKPERVDDR